MTNYDLFGNPIINDSEDVYKSKSKPKDLSNETETEFILEVICKDEKAQEKIYNELTKRNFKCRVLTL